MKYLKLILIGLFIIPSLSMGNGLDANAIIGLTISPSHSVINHAFSIYDDIYDDFELINLVNAFNNDCVNDVEEIETNVFQTRNCAELQLLIKTRLDYLKKEARKSYRSGSSSNQETSSAQLLSSNPCAGIEDEQALRTCLNNQKEMALDKNKTERSLQTKSLVFGLTNMGVSLAADITSIKQANKYYTGLNEKQMKTRQYITSPAMINAFSLNPHLALYTMPQNRDLAAIYLMGQNPMFSQTSMFQPGFNQGFSQGMYNPLMMSPWQSTQGFMNSPYSFGPSFNNPHQQNPHAHHTGGRQTGPGLNLTGI
jgi:hypothetical protein